MISFQVYDKDRLSNDDFLGELELNVLKLIDNSDKPMRLDTTKTHHPSSPTSFIHFVAEYFELSPVLHFHEGVEDRQKSRGAAAALEFGASLLGKRGASRDEKSDAALDRFRKAGKKSQAVLEVRARGARGLTPEMAT